MNKNKKLINALLVSTMMLSGLALDVSAADKLVERIDGKDRVETSINVSNKAYTTADSVVVAGWNGEADALTGTLLASAKEAPLLLVSNKDDDIAAVRAKIESLGAKTVYLLGDTNVISEKAANALGKDLIVERIAGADRFDTAVEVAKEVGSTTGHAFITVDGRSGELADALAAGPAAGKKNSPILLTSMNSLPDQTKKALKDLDITSVTIVGGKVAVSPSVRAEVRALGITVHEIEGADRSETAAKIAETYFADSKKVIIANDGRVSYADALVGGYFGAKEDAPVLLTTLGRNLETNTANYLGEKAMFAYVLGGEKVVNQDTVTEVEEILTKDQGDSEDLSVKSAKAIGATTLSVTLSDNSVHTVELDIVLRPTVKTDVTFFIDGNEYEAEVVWAGRSIAEIEADIEESYADQLAKGKALADVKAELEKAHRELSNLTAPGKNPTNEEVGAAQDKIIAAREQVAEAEEVWEDARTTTRNLRRELSYAGNLQQAIKDAEDSIAEINPISTLEYTPMGSDLESIERAREDVDSAVAMGANEDDIDGIEYLRKAEARMLLQKAKYDVQHAENYPTQDNVDAAQDSLDEVAENNNITRTLQSRIDVIQGKINVWVAEFYTKLAEDNLAAKDYTAALERHDQAVEAVAKVKDADVKAEFEARLKAVADKLAARPVEVMIYELPEVAALTIDDKDAVEAARAAFDALEDEQKDLVAGAYKTKLEALEDRIIVIEEYLQGLEDQAAATNVHVLINDFTNTDEINAEYIAKVQAARAAYDDLTEEAEKLVNPGHVTKLEKAEKRIADAQL